MGSPCRESPRSSSSCAVNRERICGIQTISGGSAAERRGLSPEDLARGREALRGSPGPSKRGGTSSSWRQGLETKVLPCSLGYSCQVSSALPMDLSFKRDRKRSFLNNRRRGGTQQLPPRSGPVRGGGNLFTSPPDHKILVRSAHFLVTKQHPSLTSPRSSQ